MCEQAPNTHRVVFTTDTVTHFYLICLHKNGNHKLGLPMTGNSWSWIPSTTYRVGRSLMLRPQRTRDLERGLVRTCFFSSVLFTFMESGKGNSVQAGSFSGVSARRTGRMDGTREVQSKMALLMLSDWNMVSIYTEEKKNIVLIYTEPTQKRT